jgi:heme/copper-type cytochrome/quinol oxidase subunit 2
MNILYNHKINNKYDFLDSGSYICDGIISLNDHILYYEIILIIIVNWMLLYIIINKKEIISIKDIKSNSKLEVLWTIIPGIILILIAIPSYKILYLMDDKRINSNINVKVVRSSMILKLLLSREYRNRFLYKSRFKIKVI